MSVSRQISVREYENKQKKVVIKSIAYSAHHFVHPDLKYIHNATTTIISARFWRVLPLLSLDHIF